MSKRRIFDIDFPEGAGPAPAPAAPGPQARRGPMAAAIGENADALRARSAAEAAIREENDRLAHEHVRLKKAGLITDLVPLDAIASAKLTRDRKPGRDADLDELKASIREVGLSNPIMVEAVGEGAYELIQGYRRLAAFRELHAETGEDRFAAIPAGLIAHGEQLELLYRRMVDENLVRRDISFGEMAQLVRAYARDPETAAETVDEALTALFGSASRQKRSYVRHFVTVIEALGSRLKFPEAIPRALGLQLEKRISNEPGAAARIGAALTASMASTPEAELEALKAQATAPRQAGTPRPRASAAKTTFRQEVKAGSVRCAAAQGRVEMRMDRDFSNVSRRRLEAAVAAFFQALDADG
ncbi:MAG: ParB N-terminal domain-containing protein [Rhodobacteraceae bacterium]|nr:ParB N-terminal domain-containing protein [Paracoccaceae bacterium]